ncbi:unnamed protein product, partial [Adineta ricciae]
CIEKDKTLQNCQLTTICEANKNSN